MPALVQATKDFNLSFKFQADRTLRHLLDGGSAQAVGAFAAGCSDQELVKFVKDYAKRIISQLSADSDNEQDKW